MLLALVLCLGVIPASADQWIRYCTEIGATAGSCEWKVTKQTANGKALPNSVTFQIGVTGSFTDSYVWYYAPGGTSGSPAYGGNRRQFNRTAEYQIVHTCRVAGSNPAPYLKVYSPSEVQLYNGIKTHDLYFNFNALKPCARSLTFDAGADCANKQIEILNWQGNVVATVNVPADHIVTWTPGGYVFMLPYAQKFAEKFVGSAEIVQDNDCATFVSHILTSGGISVYQPYTHKGTGSNPDPSTGLYDQLRDSGIPCLGSLNGSVSITQAQPGDVILLGGSGHAMFVYEYDPARGYHLMAHSTSAKNVYGVTDNCWVQNLNVNIIIQTSHYVYRYRLKETTGNVKVVKKDVDTGAVLQGAWFELRDSTGTAVGTGTTNASGEIVWEGLEPGDYTVVETQCPPGYQ